MGAQGDRLMAQCGCEWSAPKGWRNFDASPTLRLERVPLLGRLWTKNASRLPDNAECGDIVKGLPVPAGGVFRLVLPDLRFCANEYVADRSPEAALTFMRATSLGREQRARGLRGLLVLWLGNSAHLWMWDHESMAAELTKAGFCDIRRAVFHDSLEPCFLDVEDEDRWRDGLGIECRRPGEAATAGA